MRKTKKFIRAFLFTTALTIFVFSSYKLINYSQETKISSDYNGSLVEQIVDTSPALFTSVKETSLVLTDENSELSSETQYDETPKEILEVSPISIGFNALLQENADIVGWLYCPDSPINYPVVQSEDNEYYLRRLINGEWNISGSLFMDYRNNPLNMDWNTVIYGHNMKNDSMFGTLPSYCSQDYYEQHPIIYFLTPETDYKIELLSGFVTPSNSELYNIYLSESDRTQVLSDILNSSDFTPQIEFEENERLFTLSTCSYEYDTARYVVIGKMIKIAKLNEHSTS